MFRRCIQSGFPSFLIFASLFLTAATSFAQSQTTETYYTIVVIEQQNREQANRLLQMVQAWGYSPSSIEEQTDGSYRVVYGSFKTREEADAALKKMKSEGVAAREIVTQTRQKQAQAGTYISIVVQEFRDAANAETVQQKLRDEGFTDVETHQEGQFTQVLAGHYDKTQAAEALTKLRLEGYQTARTKEVEAAGSIPSPIVVPGEGGGREAGPQLSPLITQSALWNQLTEDQKRQVISFSAMQKDVRSGDTLAPQIVDLNKRLQTLDDQVRAIINRMDEQTKQEQDRTEKVAAAFKEVENLARAREYDQAILKLQGILKIDPNNQLAIRRIRTLQELIEGKPEGSEVIQEHDIRQDIQDAERLYSGNESNSSEVELAQALLIWQRLKSAKTDTLPKDLKEKLSTADSRIVEIEGKLSALQQVKNQAKTETDKKLKIMWIALPSAGGALAAITLLVWWRGHRRHQVLMQKIQEITQVRPMRELDKGSTTGLLSGSGTASDNDLFLPKTPRGTVVTDPLGGVSDDILGGTVKGKDKKNKKDKGGKGKDAPSAPSASLATDDIFGDINTDAEARAQAPTVPDTLASSSDMNLDDIFGDVAGGSVESEAESSGPSMDDTLGLGMGGSAGASSSGSGGDADDPFANLFGDDEPPKPKAAPAAKKAAAPKHVEESMSPISFGDFGGGDEPIEMPSADATGDSQDLLAAFDQQTDSDAPVASFNERMANSPFASLLDDSAPSISPMVEEDTELPAISLDMEGSDVQQQDDTLDLPSFSSLDDSASGHITATGGQSGGVLLDFENDTIGQKPPGWEGDYPYAILEVRADTPPKGSQQYLHFEKKAGDGKALYSYPFPPVTGLIGIEFDMRCNDKNKFLLGFYLERDGDFQQAIHTKILRSEVQTTPMIHMQGESAPYLLGSWAHIKYIVDLSKGVLNGYIDSTHVINDLTLENNPGMLNTLAIHDNINTTGIMLLNNIQVYTI